MSGLLSERQYVLVGMVMSKRDMQKEAPKKYQVKVFQKPKELEEQRAEEALGLVQKKQMLIMWKAKEKEQHVCKDWEERGRLSVGMTLEAICLGRCARPPWHVTGKKCAPIL